MSVPNHPPWPLSSHSSSVGGAPSASPRLGTTSIQRYDFQAHRFHVSDAFAVVTTAAFVLPGGRPLSPRTSEYGRVSATYSCTARVTPG